MVAVWAGAFTLASGTAGGPSAATAAGTVALGLVVGTAALAATRALPSRTNELLGLFGSASIASAGAAAALWAGWTAGSAPDLARGLLAALVFALTLDAETRGFRRDEAARDIDETRVMRAELSAQRMRIAPHFLFNVLNAVSGLVALGRTAEAGQVIDRTADFFRRLDRAGRDERVRLRDEIDTLQAYFDVEQARFGDRMQVRLRLDPEVTGALLPPLLLQPLAENAVKHGVARATGPVRVTVSAVNDGTTVTVEIADDAPQAATSGVDPQGSGHEIVRRTLAAAWGPRARLTVVQSLNGFRAAVVFPLELERARKEAA